MTTTLPLLTREDVLQLPSELRIPYTEQLHITYPRWTKIHDLIKERHQKQAYAAEPPCLLIVGPTGAGKSDIIKAYAKDYPATYTEQGKYMPILRCTIPAPANIAMLVTKLLHSLGDPRANYGTIAGKTFRLQQFIRDCRVELFILDELQHFVDLDSQKVLLNMSNWLKTLIKETGVACVLVGLIGEAEQVVDTNPQLARLFGDPQVLHPFQWDVTKPEQTITEFRACLKQLQEILPLRQASQSNLDAMERAVRCFVATDGLMAHIMTLIRNATAIALEKQQEYLSDDILSTAFLEHLASERRSLRNPFEESDVVVVARSETAHHRTIQPSTNRRGKRRKERTPTARDIIRG